MKEALLSPLTEAGRCGLFLLRMLRGLKPGGELIGNVLQQTFLIGGRSLVIIMICGFFVGMVLALQSINALQQFGASDQVSLLVGKSLFRELGPVLTALLFAQAFPERVLSFFNIEGNVAPEDCFLSRQIIEYPADTPDDFLRDFQRRARERREFGLGLYAAALPQKVRATTFHPIFTSMVALSDTEPLLDMFVALKCPKTFVHGVQNPPMHGF